MGEDTPFEDCAIPEALRDEVGQIDCCVNADGCEGCCRVGSFWDFGFWKNTEVRDDVFEPGTCGKEFIEPLPRCCLGIFVAIQNNSI